MKNKFLTGLLFTVFSMAAIAQEKKQDVVYLSNESIIRGKIIFRDSIRLKIQTAEGNTLVFNNADIIKITSEPKFGTYQNNRAGFAHYTELGPLVAGKTTIEGVTTAAFSFQTVNGYQFNRYFFTGAGAGVDLYATQTIIPLFLSIRGDCSNGGSLVPFYFADGGYGINITQNSTNTTNFKGGLLYAAGLGLKIPFNQKAGFLISFGYRFQASSYTDNNIKKEVEYKRLAIRAGFFF